MELVQGEVCGRSAATGRGGLALKTPFALPPLPRLCASLSVLNIERLILLSERMGMSPSPARVVNGGSGAPVRDCAASASRTELVSSMFSNTSRSSTLTSHGLPYISLVRPCWGLRGDSMTTDCDQGRSLKKAMLPGLCLQPPLVEITYDAHLGRRNGHVQV